MPLHLKLSRATCCCKGATCMLLLLLLVLRHQVLVF
jgi:hypothetical protein